MSTPYRSKWERTVASWLKKAKVKFEYEPDKFKYTETLRTSAYCAACKGRDIRVKRTYTPDFKLPAGSYIETKGKWTTKDRYKMIEVVKAYPDKKFRMLFMRDNKISKVSKTRYSDICKTNGIEYSIGVLPKTWLE